MRESFPQKHPKIYHKEFRSNETERLFHQMKENWTTRTSVGRSDNTKQSNWIDWFHDQTNLRCSMDCSTTVVYTVVWSELRQQSKIRNSRHNNFHSREKNSVIWKKMKTGRSRWSCSLTLFKAFDILLKINLHFLCSIQFN